MVQSNDMTSMSAAATLQFRPVPTMISVDPMDADDRSFPSPAAKTPVGATPVGLRTARAFLEACASPMADYWGDGNAAILEASSCVAQEVLKACASPMSDYWGDGQPISRATSPCFPGFDESDEADEAAQPAVGSCPTLSSGFQMMPGSTVMPRVGPCGPAWLAWAGQGAAMYQSVNVVQLSPAQTAPAQVLRAHVAQLPPQHITPTPTAHVAAGNLGNSENRNDNIPASGCAATPKSDTPLACPHKVFVDLRGLKPRKRA